MLDEQALQLLTAFVDGELTRRQRKAVLRLLHRSSEARALVGELQENVHRLRQLPRRELPLDFATTVLQAIQAPTAPTLPRRGGRRWMASAAVAAAVLLAIVGGFFFLGRTAESPTNPRPGPVAAQPKVSPWLGNLIDGTVENYARPLPMGLQIAFRDLDQPAQRERLAQGLKKGNAFHVDVTVRNREHAVQRIKNVLKDQSITLLVDPAAQAKLKEKEPKTQFVLYAENLQPDEVAAIMEQLHATSAPAKNGAPGFESLWLTSFTTDDQTQLADLMGARPEQFQPPQPKLFEDIPIVKPLDKNKDKKGETGVKTPRPQRYAVVLASGGDRPGALSPEVRRFLAARSQHRPGTVQVLLVLHAA